MEQKEKQIYRYDKCLGWERCMFLKHADRDPRYWLELGLVFIHKRDGVIMTVYRVFK